MDCRVGSPALLWLTGLTYGIVLVFSRDSERVRKGGKERERECVWEGLVSEPYCLPAREEEERVLSYYNLYFWSKELQISLYLSLAFSLPVSSFLPFHLTAYSLSLSLARSLIRSLNLAPEAISGEVLRARSVTADRFHKYNKLQCVCVCVFVMFGCLNMQLLARLSLWRRGHILRKVYIWEQIWTLI